MSQVSPQSDASGSPALAVNALAASYQPRRVWAGAAWIAWVAAVLLAPFLLSSYLAMQLLPRGLFHVERADDALRGRLGRLLSGGAVDHVKFNNPLRLPRVLVYSAPHLRDFSGGLI